MATQKKKTAAAQSASSHQKDLAKISGKIAGQKKFAADRAKGIKNSENTPSPAFKAQVKATKKTAASFEKGKVAPTKKPSLIESGNKSGKLATPKIFDKALDKPNKVEKLIQDVTNRYRVTAREARDIVTAVGTVANLATNKNAGKAGAYNANRGKEVGKATSNLVKQVKETVTAATTGKKGTLSGQMGTNVGEHPYIYVAGNKTNGKPVKRK